MMLRTLFAASLVASFAGCARPAPQAAQAPSPPLKDRPLIVETYPGEQAMGEPGWILSGGAGNSYVVHRDTQDNRPAWLLEPASDTFGRYGTWMRQLDATAYRTKRVRITASVMTQGATRRVDFWARAQAADSPSDGSGLGGDWHRLPANSAWTEESIVLDVPAQTAWLEYGVGVAGPGKVWLERATVETVGQDVPVTARSSSKSRGGATESPIVGWFLAGDAPDQYAILSDSVVKRSGRASGSLRSLSPQTRGFGTLMQSIDADPYLGKRVRLSAYVKADNVTRWAGLWMRVDGQQGQKPNAFDNMGNRPIKGTSDWTRYEVVLDVARDSSGIAFGILLTGGGQVWMDDANIEIVPDNVPTTGASRQPAPQNMHFDQ